MEKEMEWSRIRRSSASLAKVIKHCDKLKFPNAFTLIKIGYTLPVPSAEWQRSFSVMRRLRTLLRSTMKSDRLSLLTIINTHRNVEVNYKEATKLFFTLYPRKIQESSLIFGWNIIFTEKVLLFFFSISLKNHYQKATRKIFSNIYRVEILEKLFTEV